MGSTVANSVISLFFIMLVGLYAQRKGIITPEINKGINNILLSISLPMLILSSFMTSFDDGLKDNLYNAFLFSFIAYVIVTIGSILLTIPIKGREKSVIKFSSIFTNTAFMGLPLLNAIFGSEGIIYGAVFNMFFNLYVFTYGVILFKGAKKGNETRKYIIDIIKNPVIISVFIGLVIMILSLKVPANLENSIRLIGSMTTPLSMISIGFIFGRVKIREHLRDWTIYYAIFIKLIIMPLLMIIFFKLVDNTSVVATSIVVLMALPTATMASIFAERFDNQVEYTTIIVVSTTLLSIITIPIMVGLFSR